MSLFKIASFFHGVRPMGMILLPAFFILAILVIAIGVSLKNGHGVTAICFTLVGGALYYYFIFPFLFCGH
jgi:hypothetical protein